MASALLSYMLWGVMEAPTVPHNPLHAWNIDSCGFAINLLPRSENCCVVVMNQEALSNLARSVHVQSNPSHRRARVEGSISRRTGLLLSILVPRPLIQRVYGPASCYVIARIEAPGAYCPGGLWSVVNVTGSNGLEGRGHSHGRRLITLAVGGVLPSGPKAKVMERKGKSQPMTLKSVDKGDE